MISLCSTLTSGTSNYKNIASLCCTFISDTPSCSNLYQCCSTFYSGTPEYKNTKDIDTSLGCRIVVLDSNISVTIPPVMASGMATDVDIPWAPSDVDAENNTTRWGDNRPSMLNYISHEAVYTQSAAYGSDNHTCILSTSNSNSYHNTSTKCCTNISIHVSSAATHSSETDSLDIFNLELDSHANMPVVGRGTYIVAHTGRTADLQAYNPDYESMQIPIFDASL